MIEAAERLFVERGVGTVSLRDVQKAAGQRNKSAAQYHFGNRDGLISAIIDTRMGPVNARRREVLDGFDRRGGEQSRRELVEALVEPLAAETLGRPGSHYARFLVQAQFDPALASLINHHLEADSFQDVCRRLARQLDHLPTPIRDERIKRLLTMVVTTLATWEGRAHGDLGTAARVGDLIDSCVGCLDAPLSATTQRELTASARTPA